MYNHERAIVTTVNSLLSFKWPILLVDDGSSANCHAVLLELSEQYPSQVTLLTRPVNGGKGAAVKSGLRHLLGLGYSHAVQVDADGQHDVSDLPNFIDRSIQSPDALIVGTPEYDASVPRLRFFARYLTHVWVWINSLSTAIEDSMCGFRVYPLRAVCAVLNEEHTGDRMDFDPEILVRWVWRRHAIVNLPTKVQYPLDGVSHFMAWRDNALISAMHTRLFFGMLKRLPRLLWHHQRG